MNRVWLITLLLLGSLSTLKADAPLAIAQEDPSELVIYNRILAKVNGKTLSVIDVVKKMELFLQKHYPQLATSTAARYQFFSTQWKEYLTQMVDTELMLADAERLEVKVSEAEVREEILNRFGPNIMPALDKMGIPYDEAKALIHDELLVQKMLWFRVNSKALLQVNSQDVKTAYQQHIEKNPAMQQWIYQVLSIRSPDPALSESAAAEAFKQLQENTPLSTVAENLKLFHETLSVTLSPDLQSDDKTIAASHKDVLKTLSPSTYSHPVAQVSKTDNATVFRIFHLKDHVVKTVPSFQKIADQLKDALLQEAANRENAHYLRKLRDRLGYDERHMLEPLPENFEPFALK